MNKHYFNKNDRREYDFYYCFKCEECFCKSCIIENRKIYHQGNTDIEIIDFINNKIECKLTEDEWIIKQIIE